MTRSYSPHLLRARVQAHDLSSAGFDSEKIAQRLGTEVRKINRWLREPRPDLPAAPLTAWSEDAACGGAELSLFFPEQLGNLSHNKRRAAQICRGCPVQRQCRQTAFANFEQHGIWGGIDFSKLSYGFDVATGVVTVTPKDQRAQVA